MRAAAGVCILTTITKCIEVFATIQRLSVVFDNELAVRTFVDLE